MRLDRSTDFRALSRSARRAILSLRLRGIFLCLALLQLTACAVNPPLQLADISSRRQPVMVPAVPFYPQQKYQCGPAALAGVLGASGVAVVPGELTPEVYLPGRQGSLQVELLAATRRAGRIAYLVGPRPADLVAQLEAGIPVLVLQNLRTPHFPAWHYAVLVGFDAGSNQFFLNTGRDRAKPVDARKFLRTWDWGGRWGMESLIPGSPPPPAADAARFVAAVADFEGVAGPEAAAPAWRVILDRWPDNPWPYLALGNQAQADARFEEAVEFYRRGVSHKPGNPALINNLAATMAGLGCPDAAATLLRPEINRLGDDSAWRPVLQATLEETASRLEAGRASCWKYTEP